MHELSCLASGSLERLGAAAAFVLSTPYFTEAPLTYQPHI
jgi:hypothetical protein